MLLRTILCIVVVVPPFAWSWYLRSKLVNRRRAEFVSGLGPFEALRPDRYTDDALPILYRYWISVIVTLFCGALVVGVLRP